MLSQYLLNHLRQVRYGSRSMEYGYRLLHLQETVPISGKVAHGCSTPRPHLLIHSGCQANGCRVTGKGVNGYLAIGQVQLHIKKSGYLDTVDRVGNGFPATGNDFKKEGVKSYSKHM